MSFTPEQFSAVTKSNVDAMLDLSYKAFASVEKLVGLNLQAAKASLEESAEHAKALLSVKDPQELLALQASMMQPAAEKVASYGRQVYEIAQATQAEIAKLAETQATAAQQKVSSLIDTAVKNAPAGSENAVALVKSALSAANNAYDSVQKAAKQAQGVAEANFQALQQTATNAAKAATQAAPKATTRRAA
ncbi:MAG: TIGR01841 family phasin [Burkholderiales bacterium]